MKILRIIILLSCLGISYTVAQRRQQNAAEVQPDAQQSPVAATRGRGRARFVKTPEFEQVSSDYAAAARSSASDGRSEGKSRSLGAGNIRRNSISSTSTSPSITRRLYEVQEIVDDIPDRSSVYHRPRVITEDKFEIPNAPRSTLFETPRAQNGPQEAVPVDELIRSFGTLRSDEPTKLELPQILPQVEYDSESSVSSSTTSKESVELSSSTTEREMERELMKNDHSTKRPESTTADITSTTAAHGRRTVVRSRGNVQRQSTESSVTAAPVRTRVRSKPAASNRVDSPEVTSRRTTAVEGNSENITRGSFRVGRRRPTSPLKDRGPSVIDEDSQSPKTRTGRDSNISSYQPARRGSVRNSTPRASSEAVEATTRNRSDVRRSRGRKIDSPQTTENVPNVGRSPEFSSRRTRTRTQVNSQTVQEPAPPLPRISGRTETAASGRNLQEPIRARTQHVENIPVATPTRESRSRTRSRFQLGDIENVKLEPQQSIEHSTRALPRRTGRTRPPIVQAEELIASSTVENPIRVTLPPTSTVRSVNSIPTRIKESVHSEISEVVSSRKVTRRKKPDAKVASKKSQEEDDIDDLNYPPQFKAIILANKSKEEKKPDSAALSSSFSGSSSSIAVSTTSTTSAPATSPTSTTLLSTTTGLLTTSAFYPPKHVEDVDNDLAPTPRPTRRRFSVSTRKPNFESHTTTRKPKTFPTRKIVANPDSEKLAKFHARFNNQYQRNNTRSSDETISSTLATTKRTTKPSSKLSYTRKADKLVERKFNQPPPKSNRYSARYRSETRSSVPTRAATSLPVYVPTVPTVTPAAFSTHQAPKTNDERAITDEIDDIKIISIAQPNANPLYSDNLVTENNITVNSSDATNQPTGSILERIINSISSISTTTSKPDAKVLPTETAILKIPPSPKKKAEDNKRIQKALTTEKPTTIIERILNSLSAIQASDNNVGNAGAIDKTVNELDSVLNAPASQKVPTLVKGAPQSSVSSSTPPAITTSTTFATTSTMKAALAPTKLPMQNTVAISLADYLASLGIAKTQSSLTLDSAITSTTIPPSTTVLDENKNTIDYLETTTGFVKLTTAELITAASTIRLRDNLADTTLSPTTATMSPTTNPPMTTIRNIITTTNVPTTTFNWLARILGFETTTQIMTTTTKPDTTTTNNVDSTTMKLPESTTFVTMSTTDVTSMDTSTRMLDTTIDGTSTTVNPTSLPANTLKIDITTPIVNVSPNSVTITSPSDVNNKNTDSPTTTNSNNRTGKLLERLVEEINNEITSSKQNNNATNAPTSGGTSTTMSPEDYFIFAVLPNNTIVRKRPRKISAPYFIYGVYPNNTIIRKFPNGTLVPDDPVVQVSGFDTRDPLPPRPMITSNRVNEPEGTDDARDLTEVNQLSLDLNNDTATLTGKTLEEYTNLINQTITTAPSTTTDSTMSTTPASVTSTLSSSTEQDDLNDDIVSTEMSIDVTTLNIPMIIELGPTTESDLVENITVSSANSIDSTRRAENIVSTISATTLDPLDTTTNLGKIESKSSFESESIEELEDTTLPMPDTSTIVMTSTSTPAETTITPDSNYAPISTDWTINPTSIRTTTLPTSSDELDNEIRNSGSTSRVEEISTSTATSLNKQTVATNAGVPSTTPRTTTGFTTEPYITTTVPTTRATTRRITTTTPTTTTARPTTTTRQITTTTRPITTTFIPPTTTFRTTTTDITTFIANILSTLRPVYTPTTVQYSTFPTTTETTTAPTVTITARRRTTTTTEPTTTVRATNVRRRTMPTTTTEPTIITQSPFRDNIVASTIPTTTFRLDTTTIDASKLDIDEIVKKSKKKLTPEQLEEIEQLKALEREQANLLQQLSLLTNLNLNGQPKKDSGRGNLANRIVQFAKERDQTTTEIPIYTELPSTRIPKNLPALDSKGTTVEDILKELNAAQNSVGDGGRSQDAIIAEILKQRGIEPSTPKSLSDAFRPTTTRRPRTTTTQRPGRIMQGLNWLLTQFGGPPPPAPAPAPPKPRTTRRTTTTTSRPDDDELHFQSTELNNVIHNTPTNSFKRPVNSLSDEELSRLINQLEAIQRDPKQAQNLDITPFRKLQSQSTTLNNKNVEIFTTGGGSNQVTRSPKAAESSRVRTAKSTTSNSIEDLDEDNEVTTARARVPQATRPRASLPPVELNHVPGIEDSQGPQIGGNFLNAAVNVTRAISTFLGAAIQGAARSFQSAIGSSSSSAGGLFRASG